MLRIAIDKHLKRIGRRRPSAAVVILIGQLIEDLAGACGVEAAGQLVDLGDELLGRSGGAAGVLQNRLHVAAFLRGALQQVEPLAGWRRQLPPRRAARRQTQPAQQIVPFRLAASAAPLPNQPKCQRRRRTRICCPATAHAARHRPRPTSGPAPDMNWPVLSSHVPRAPGGIAAYTCRTRHGFRPASAI